MLTHGLSIYRLEFNNLEFVDDIDLLGESLERLQESLELVTKAAMWYDLNINIEKNKIMVFGDDALILPLTINHEEIETVNQFIYLGSLISLDNGCDAEIRRRIGIASRALDNLQKLWNSPNINLGRKKKVLQTCVFSTFLYASETWTLKEVDKNK